MDGPKPARDHLIFGQTEGHVQINELAFCAEAYVVCGAVELAELLISFAYQRLDDELSGNLFRRFDVRLPVPVSLHG